MRIVSLADSVDITETAHKKPSHLALQCMHSTFSVSKKKKKKKIVQTNFRPGYTKLSGETLAQTMLYY